VTLGSALMSHDNEVMTRFNGQEFQS
jgi:hypothetical protein